MLVIGGSDNTNQVLASAEIFDPQTNTWSSAASMRTPRVGHTATMLLDGKVLVVAGGANSTVDSVSGGAELYDPVTNTWTGVPSLRTPRARHVAALLPNGTVLIAGGTGSTNPLASAELYDPAANAWTSVASLGQARQRAAATLLPNGKVLVVGGIDNGGSPRWPAGFSTAPNSTTCRRTHGRASRAW